MSSSSSSSSSLLSFVPVASAEHLNTLCVHAGTVVDDKTFGVTSPLYVSTANRYPNETNTFFYPREQSLPNQVAVAQKVAALEGAEDGVVFSSGMAAITTTIFAMAAAGDHVVFTPQLYGGTLEFAKNELNKHGVLCTLAKSGAVRDVEAAITPKTKLIYIETPSNPLLDVLDVRAFAALGRRLGIVTAADNTFATPINQSVVAMGIDIAIHSATKYLSGHSDLASGVVVSSKALTARIRAKAIVFGGNLSPRDSQLLERSLKTLNLRVQQQNRNALAVAQFLEKHPAVERVNYPGLTSHPNHALAKSQMRGFGGMLSFELRGTVADASAAMNRFRVISNALSLGGIETTACLPTVAIYKNFTPEQRAAIGVKDTLVRVSVGIEDTKDLLDDLQQALSSRPSKL